MGTGRAMAYCYTGQQAPVETDTGIADKADDKAADSADYRCSSTAPADTK